MHSVQTGWLLQNTQLEKYGAGYRGAKGSSETMKDCVIINFINAITTPHSTSINNNQRCQQPKEFLRETLEIVNSGPGLPYTTAHRNQDRITISALGWSLSEKKKKTLKRLKPIKRDKVLL